MLPVETSNLITGITDHCIEVSHLLIDIFAKISIYIDNKKLIK